MRAPASRSRSRRSPSACGGCDRPGGTDRKDGTDGKDGRPGKGGKDGSDLLVSPSLPSVLSQNLNAARSTTVRGGRIAVGDKYWVSVERVPVVGSVNAVAGVSDRTCHTQLVLVRLSRSSV